jgi:hypothetical protein
MVPLDTPERNSTYHDCQNEPLVYARGVRNSLDRSQKLAILIFGIVADFASQGLDILPPPDKKGC